jgi:hypothetical protein
MVATVGVKIANGEFYPIIDENSSVKKRLVLTTVHDNQESVQIDLYKSYTKTMSDGLYIGSLVVENIHQRAKGEPSIELIVSCDAEGHISAEALDLDTGSGGQHQYLSVSLKSLDENRDIELPDFELDSHESSQGIYERASALRETQNREKKRPWPLIIILGVLVIMVCLALFLDREQINQEKAGAVTAESPRLVSAQSAASEEPVPGDPPVPVEPPVPVPGVEAPPPPLIQAPAQPAPAPALNRTRNPPVASYKVPATIPRNGVAYRIRWGDTLWDIAEAFYRDPWLYPRIARYNGIRNPDHIISGTTIRVPPKN